MYTPYNIFNIESNLPKYKPGGAAASNSDPDEAKVGQIFFDDSSNSWKVITEVNSDGEITKYTTLEKHLETNGLKGPGGDYTEDYTLLESILTKDNVKQALWDRYTKNEKNLEVRGQGKRYKEITSADELVQNYLEYEKKLMAVNAQFTPDELKALDLDKTSNRPDRDLFLKQTGLYDPNDKNSDLKTAAFQKMYDDLATIMDDPNVDKSIKTELEPIDWSALGDVDTDSTTKKGKKGSGNISFIDAIVGDNTIRQVNRAKAKQPITTTTTTSTYTAPKLTPGVAGKQYEVPKTGWFPQDLNNIVAAGLFPPQRYMPTRFSLDAQEVAPAFYDYTTDVAIGMRPLAMGIEGAMQMANPQGYNAMVSPMAEQASAQAQQAIARTAQANIQTANQFNMYNAQERGRTNQLNLGYKKNYADELARVNNNFDIERRSYFNNLTKYLNSGITNAEMARTFNTLGYEYFLDPSTGGRLVFNPNATPELIASEQDPYVIRENALNKFLANPAYINYTPEQKIDMFNSVYGQPGAMSSNSTRNQSGKSSQKDLEMLKYLYQNLGYGTQNNLWGG